VSPHPPEEFAPSGNASFGSDPGAIPGGSTQARWTNNPTGARAQEEQRRGLRGADQIRRAKDGDASRRLLTANDNETIALAYAA